MIRNTGISWFAALCICFPAFAGPATVNNIEIPPGARVDLVFYTADDCVWCKRWKESGKDDAVKWANRAKFGYHEIAKPRIADPYRVAHFPTDSLFAWEALKTEHRLNFMIPRWVVFADGQKIVEGTGLHDWGRVSRFVGDVLEARDRKKQ